MRQLTAVTLALSFALASSVFAQDKGRDDERRNNESRQRPAAAFQQYFRLRGIEFSPEQQAKVDEIRREFAPQLVQNQSKWNSVLSREQQRARQEAIQKGRDAGKQGQELRESVNVAIKITNEQKKRQAILQEERNRLLGRIRTQLTALLTDAQRAATRRRRGTPNRVPPTRADLKYGPHERNVMDVWLAKSDKPTPVLISIHGGGFRGGNKSVNASLLRDCLDSGISVAAITYRFSSHAIAPASFHDSARAVQYIRHHAKEWNIDPTKFAATGGSAGAGISLWLGFHDDLADPDNDDPVLRQSTRLTCMMVTAGQSSYDPRFIRKLFPEFETYKHGALAQLFDVDLNNLDELPKKKYELFEEVSPIHHLTKDDAPAMLTYGGSLEQKVTNVNIGIHHARFGKALKDKMDALGIRCEVYAGTEVLGGGQRVAPIDFMRRNFGMNK